MDQIREFATKDEASAWMDEQVDDPCVDNHRFAWLDDGDGMSRYEEQADTGCCGRFDARVRIAGREAMIGCNYGH